MKKGNIAHAILGAITAIALALAVFTGVNWFSRENSYRQEKHYAPREEQVRRDTFRESEAHVQGTINQVRDLQTRWLTSDEETRPMLKTTARKLLDEIDQSYVPSDLHNWLNQN